jgi:hypothetical protein
MLPHNHRNLHLTCYRSLQQRISAEWRALRYQHPSHVMYLESALAKTNLLATSTVVELRGMEKLGPWGKLE